MSALDARIWELFQSLTEAQQKAAISVTEMMLAATVIDTNPDLVMFREGLPERVRLAFTHVLMDTVHLSSVENVSHWDTGRRN